MNDLSYLHPEFIKRLEKLESSCNNNNVRFSIVTTLRTAQEQNYLYAKGRLSPGEIVTCGQAPNNYHCWGLAVDIAANELDYGKIGALAEQLGLTWGGHNREYINIAHIEYQLDTLKHLRFLYKDYNTFRIKTWDPKFDATKIMVIGDSTTKSANKNKELIEHLQRACNMDKFRSRGGKILELTKTLDDNTIQAFNSIKMELDKRYSTIKRIQIVLNQLGYKLVVTGKYDKDTKNSLIRFQRLHGLVPSGNLNADTIILMLSKI